MKIAIGLSGGVDSTIAAYMLKEQGHELIGLTMKIWDDSYVSSNTKSACFGPDEVEDIEEALQGVPQTEVSFHFDKSRDLHIIAKDLGTGSMQSKTLRVQKGVAV